MVQTDFVTAIRQHAEPLAADLGLEVWGIEFTGGTRPVVRLFVEAPRVASSEAGELSQDGTGVDIEQCAELSRRLGLALEVDELFTGAWTLEVSSPGFERPFFYPTQLPPYVDRELEIVLASPLADWPGRKKFRGVLCAVADDQATLLLDASQRRPSEPERVVVPWAYVRRAHLIHIFADPEKPGKKKAKSPAKASGSGRGGCEPEERRAVAEDLQGIHEDEVKASASSADSSVPRRAT